VGKIKFHYFGPPGKNLSTLEMSLVTPLKKNLPMPMPASLNFALSASFPFYQLLHTTNNVTMGEH